LALHLNGLAGGRPLAQEQSTKEKEMITYRGEKFSGYNKPKKTPGGKKKSAVLAKKGSTVKLVRFGDPTLSIKKDQPARKKSYCARSAGQGNTSNIFSANYWSRRAWSC
jgi:hypothetical protein